MTIDEAIVEIKKQVVLVDEVEVWTRLHRPDENGKAGWLGLCPFHKEKSPSFNVRTAKNPDTGDTYGYYKCFGCGASGDAITFIKEIEKISAKDAIRKLAFRLNIELDDCE